MPLTVYEPIQKSKVEYQIHERYLKEITELEALGFRDLCYTREVVFPLSLVVFFWLYPILRLNREIVRIEAPLRYVLLNPLLASYEYGTYAHIFAKGVKFYTGFLDGTLLISSTFSGMDVIRPEAQFYKYYASQSRGRSITDTWRRHWGRIEQFEQQGSQTMLPLALEHFEVLSQRDDNITLFGASRRKKSN